MLRPLVLADVQRIQRAARDERALTSVLMVQQALVEPTVTVEQVNRMHAGLVEFLLGEVNRISGLQLDRDELEEAVQAPLARACFVLARRVRLDARRVRRADGRAGAALPRAARERRPGGDARAVTGSQAPQRAIRRLALLGGRSERLGSALASSPLLDDPIAVLTGVSLDESALEAVLLRLEGNAAGSTAAAAARPRAGIAARRARRRTSPIAPALRAEAAELPVDVRIRAAPREPAAGPGAAGPDRGAGVGAWPLEPLARPDRAAAATRAGSQASGSPSATSSLARAAARVPGGARGDRDARRGRVDGRGAGRG